MRAADRPPLHPDRLLTLAMDALRPRRDPPPDRLPILMYHSVADDLDVERRPYFRTVTRPATFAAQMRWLKAAGYRAVSLQEAADPTPAQGSARDAAGSARHVVLTFDDGFADFATAAFPAIAAHGFTATVFVASAYLDGRFLDGRRCLGAAEVAGLARAGIEFGSHTATHPQLQGADDGLLHGELAASRDRIEAITGQAVRSFSYPYRFPEEDGVFVGRLRAMLRATGYRWGVTTAIGTTGPTDERLFLRRLPVNDLDDERLFAAKLRGSYDWLHAAQIAVKRSRRLVGRTHRPASPALGSPR